jgi:tRNA threonylcarbamoyladenosine biosynthesis protein TsaE
MGTFQVMNSTIQIISHSVEETFNLGKSISQHLGGGETIALIGPLGSGKTHLVKGLALGFNVSSKEVNSPTFTLINEYEGRLKLYHIDAYRLDNPQQLEALGFDELCDSHSVVIVEWADLVWPLIAEFDPITIKLSYRSETERIIDIENCPKPLHEALQN